MEIAERLKLIDKVIEQKDNILLDYISFNSSYRLESDTIIKKWEQHIREQADIGIRFYIHIPFCSKICSYCMYDTIKIEHQDEIETYVSDTIGYLEKFKYIFQNISFEGLYIGGGTPSLLGEKNMERLFGYLFSNFRFQEGYYKTIELNPSSTSFKKLDILYKYGFDRVSFGVQSFNKNTLKIENRTYVSPHRMKQLIDYAKKLGFADINTDIIVGLNNEGEEEVLENLKKIKQINPYTITMYTILKDMQRSVFYKKDKESFYKEINMLYDRTLKNSQISDNYIRANWSHVLGLTLNNKNKPPSKKVYDAHNEDKQSLFGVGYKAYSKLWGVGNYSMSHFSKKNVIYKYESSSELEEMYSYILQTFQYKINKKDFLEKFGFHISEKFQDVIDYLKLHAVVEENQEEILYIGDEKRIGYYGLLFLDTKNLIKFIKQRFHEKK